MMDQQSSWTARAKTKSKARQARTWTLPDVRVDFHPLVWLRDYPLVLPTLLLAAAGLVYMLQVNQGAMLDYQLQSLTSEQSASNGRLAVLASDWYSLKSCARVCTIASHKLHMDHPTLVGAFWLTVPLPRTTPALPSEHQVSTGPLVWMTDAAKAIQSSL